MGKLKQIQANQMGYERFSIGTVSLTGPGKLKLTDITVVLVAKRS